MGSERRGGKHGYLFGTVHALPDGTSWRGPAIDSAFAKSDMLVVEVNLPQAEPRMGAVFERLAKSPGLPPLRERVDPAYRRPLQRVLAGKGLDNADFTSMESWAAALLIAQAYQVGSGANGADQVLLESAGKKPIVELEGLEYQLGLFDALPQSEQRDLLEAVIDEIDRADVQALADQRLNAWLSGDADGLAGEIDSGLLADPELRHGLLVKRNQDWAGKIEKLLKGGSHPFVAVGAAHVIGPEGLAALLEARGYTVKRLQ